MNTKKVQSFFTSRHTPLTVIALALSSMSVAQASPTVEGNAIILPDDGWYQVQDSENYNEVCGGVRRCEVSPGSYLVVNHTTGERFENVEVTASNTGGDSGIVVTDNVIRWPDDGWYQVQNAETNESLCEGGRSCVVDPGQYRVINHTTGQRFPGINVGGGQTLPIVTNLSVERYSSTAIELFWSHPESGEPADGYSVFQDGELLRTINGTSFFIEGVPDNTDYEFSIRRVGQATGSNIFVQAADSGVASTPSLSIANAESIVANVVSVLNEDAIEAFYQTLNDDELFQGKRFFITNTSDDIQNIGSASLAGGYQLELGFGQGNFVDADQASAYACRSLGAVVGYFATANQASDWSFSGCVIGSNTYNGTAGARRLMRGSINSSPVFNLTIDGADGQSRSLSGGYSSGNRSFIVVNSQSNWDSASYRGPVDGGQLEISDYTVSRSRIDNNVDFFQSTRPLPDGRIVRINEYSVSNSVEGSFSVSAPWTQNESLSVTVELAFSDDALIATDEDTGEVVEFSGSDPEEAFYWQTGLITITAEDGSRLGVVPVDGQPGDFLIVTGNGETVTPSPIEINP